MATPDSEGEIPDTPLEDQFSPRHDHDGRSALTASGRYDCNPDLEVDGDAADGGGRLRKRHSITDSPPFPHPRTHYVDNPNDQDKTSSQHRLIEMTFSDKNSLIAYHLVVGSAYVLWLSHAITEHK